MRAVVVLCCLLISGQMVAQKASIEFELNGRPSHGKLLKDNDASRNPFTKFMGEWTLKEDRWVQNWGGTTDTLKIAGHHTLSRQLNTEWTLLSIIDGPEPNGHILWAYNPNTKRVSHLSSFGEIRIGNGEGAIDENGNLQLSIRFEGEPKDTYRRYTYNWTSVDSYHMRSVQYDDDDRPTGLFYEGTFVRISSEKTGMED